MKNIRSVTLALLAAARLAAVSSGASTPAQAGLYRGDAGRTASWVYIRKLPSEGIWEACRRVYRRDVYQVRGAGERRARCYVDASEVGNPAGYNTLREMRY